MQRYDPIDYSDADHGFQTGIETRFGHPYLWFDLSIDPGGWTGNILDAGFNAVSNGIVLWSSPSNLGYLPLQSGSYDSTSAI
jgi:hypothetical protein